MKRLSAVITALALSPALAQAQVDDPILPGITVEIANVLRLPDTRGMGPEDGRSGNNYARINFLQEIDDNPNDWFINDLRGQVYRVEPSTGSITEYLDVGDEFSRFIIGPGGLSTGLIAITPHPEFASNGKFYTIHEESASGNPATPDFQAAANAGNLNNGQHGVVTEWTASDPTASVFSGTHRELIRVAQPAGNLHNLGDIGFDPLLSPGDEGYGLMYLAGGDGGYDAAGKGSRQAQRLDSVFGKLLRIDPDGDNSSNGQYGVPSDNPFANDGDSDTLAEIYAYGFRNQHRISWDLQTGVMIGTDIGESRTEEVNFPKIGGNYGWSEYEGVLHRDGSPITRDDDTSEFEWPVAKYDHGDGFAIAGGFVYRGTLVPELTGKFIYGDIVNGRIYYSDLDEMLAADADGSFSTSADVYELFLTQDGESVSIASLVTEERGGELPNNRVDLRFGQTSDGEFYLTTKQDGWVRQLTSASMAGDYNRDGVVDAADYTLWRDTLGQAGSAPAADGDGDKVVTLADYDVWRNAYGQSGAAPTTAAPEPAAALLCLAALGLPLARRGRGR
ncbi:Soluble aldose sugar dehydrogenase YliI precursor [Posidoniimonas corsicana]|uniref:Soluble aldose sugar dehydrogenase YliI n=1 Tax=Posidoniimonas corsicana TaxID=1938618 RepID=A0A5C5VFX2_9BACT|nr:PQQ-dependent sugar dehydrogenase [Posidoniimonas corsicana]TWT36983.1 Soluble aldose sugar dehydrogenase YliI precursor [Posidoniimonas corsicana]